MGMHVSVIRSDKALRKFLARNAQATGTGVAASAQGPMLLQELCTAAIDTTNKWQTQVGGTGTVSVATVSGVRTITLATALATDTASLSGIAIANMPGAPNNAAARSVWKVMNLEWVTRLGGNLTDIDNAEEIMGLAATAFSIRTSQNVIGFVFAADAINCLSDAAGAEEITVVASPPTLMQEFRKFRIRINAIAQTIQFYIDDILRATHTTVPAVPMLVNFFNAPDSNTVDMRIIDLRWWLEDEE